MNQPRTLIRTLSAVFAQSQHCDPKLRPFFLQGQALESFLASGQDLELYRARRDDEAIFNHPVLGTWRFDQVLYSGNDLPTGELCRSVGHWNPESQFELFEVISGLVHILLAAPGRQRAFWIRCEPGDLALVPPGWWHSTYCEQGPAEVVNIYSHQARSEDKYFQKAPIQLGMRRDSDQLSFFPLGRTAVSIPPPNRSSLALENDSLRSAFRAANRGALEAVIERLETESKVQRFKFPMQASQ